MDVARVAYSRPCRFLRDTDTVSTVRWQEADPLALALGVVSIIANKRMDNDDWLDDDGPGEVSDSTRTTTLAHAPRGLVGDHVCGTPADFALGGVVDTTLPPVAYGALGWPMCCNPPRRVGGGAGAGGKSAVVVTHPHIAGGAGAGGKSAYAVDPASPTPGSDCDTAPTLALDVEYSYPTIAGESSGDWFIFTGLTAAAAYHVTYSGAVGTGPLAFGLVNCAVAATPQLLTFNAPDCYEFTQTTSALLLELRTFGPSNGPYTFTVSAGAC